MKTRAILLTLIVASIGGAYLMKSGGPGAAARPAEPTPLPPTPPAAPEAPAPTVPLRNVFEYIDRATPGPVRATPVPAPPPPRASAFPAPAPAVRLIGVVRRKGEVRAALAVHGEVFVLAMGETAEGYTVTSIDEEDGVSVRAPDGTSVRLTPPAE